MKVLKELTWMPSSKASFSYQLFNHSPSFIFEVLESEAELHINKGALRPLGPAGWMTKTSPNFHWNIILDHYPVLGMCSTLESCFTCQIKAGLFPTCETPPFPSLSLLQVPMQQQWGHSPHHAPYKQGLQEKEASFLLSRNCKIPKGMKGQGRTWGRKERAVASEEPGRHHQGGTLRQRRGETEREGGSSPRPGRVRTGSPYGGTCIWQGHADRSHSVHPFHPFILSFFYKGLQNFKFLSIKSLISSHK